MLRLFHDPPAVRHFRRIVRAAHLVMKQLAPGIAHHPQQLGPAPEQVASLVQLLDPGGQRSQQSRQPFGPLLIVDFIVIWHGYLEGMIPPSVKFR